MAKFTEVVHKLVRPYYNYFIVALSLVIFASFGMLAYNRYYKNQLKSEADVANANRRRKDLFVYMFHVDWCPHCKTAKPEWNMFSRKIDGKEMNGYKIKCVDVNCTDETSEVTHFIEEFSIESYHTIKMVKDNNKIEFDSKVKAELLEQFATTMLNE